MPLLRDIQEDATGIEVPVEVLLRKCLVLATRLDHEPLKEWVHHELDGYPDGVELPPYRSGYPTILKGNFMNSAWKASGHVVPLSALPEGFQDLDNKMNFREGVSRIRQMAEQSSDGVLQFATPPGLNAHVRLFERMQCTSLWIEVSALALNNILDQVRNRVLAFALEIEQADPDAGEPTDGAARPIPDATVSHIYTTTIFGGVNAVAAGGGSVNQSVDVAVTPGDIPGLLDYLKSLGVDDGELTDLYDAITADGDERDEAGFGPRAKAWLGNASLKVATGTMRLAGATGSELLALALAKHYGLI